MKQFIITLIAIVAFTACKKENSVVYPINSTQLNKNEVAEKPQPVTGIDREPDVDFSKVYGKWAYAHDTTRWFIVKEFGDGYAKIYFPHELQSPVNRDIVVEYEMTIKGDTVDCITPNIYPCCHFKMDGSSGYAVEYLKQNGQNDYVPVIKL